MASRFEEAASLMRRMAQQGFEINAKGRQQQITHSDADVFESWGFVNEEPAFRQLTLISDPSIESPDVHERRRKPPITHTRTNKKEDNPR